MPAANFLRVLQILTNSKVDFIVVGDIAAVLHGARADTLCLAVVHSTDPENLQRLLAVLTELGAAFRLDSSHSLRLEEFHLAAPGPLLLSTEFGALDVLSTIGEKGSYSELLPSSTSQEIGSGLIVRVLNVDHLDHTQGTGRQRYGLM